MEPMVFKFSDPGCTASMILTAVLVEDKDVTYIFHTHYKENVFGICQSQL